MATITKKTADQLALSTGSFLGDTLGAALDGWQKYNDISLHKKLVDAQIEQATQRGAVPTFGRANRTGYAGAGAYFALPTSGVNAAHTAATDVSGFSTRDVEIGLFAVAMIGLLFVMVR